MTPTNPIPEGVKVATVSELTREIKSLLEEGFSSVWVAGEVSSLSKPRSGHLYFNLKDADSQLRAVIFRGIAMRLRFDLQDGQEIIVRGRMTVYSPRGDYQLVIEEAQPKGIGAAELALRQLKEKLFVRGYFDPKRKKPLPRFPKRIALVTSPTGAAVRDMLEILSRRWPAAEVWVCGVTVQGDGASEDMAAMIRRLNAVTPRVDLMIVGRGGGSSEDLWAFNEEPILHAIFESQIPVVSAVGHEIDVTLADLVADKRALTPSEAAELVVPNREELLEGLMAAQSRLKELLWQRLQTARQRWQDLSQRRAFRLPLDRIRALEQQLDDWGSRLHRAARKRLQQAQQRVIALAGQLEGLSPLNVLGRGYSLTRSESGQVIRSSRGVRFGQRIVTLLQEGKIVSRVEEVDGKGVRFESGELFGGES
jgi:exodeoxyribonuclease VII large subunit